MIHVLRLTHSERWQEKRREAILGRSCASCFVASVLSRTMARRRRRSKRGEKRDQARTEQERRATAP